jgi:hypothetical protein
VAAALAKAQAQLVNPEKSLTGVLRTGQPGAGGGRSFRYRLRSSNNGLVAVVEEQSFRGIEGRRRASVSGWTQC